jgi:hypothetical protein
VIVTIGAADVATLAELARLEALAHEPQTPARRAASHLYYALTQPPAKSAASAHTAIASFGADHVQADALKLLHQLAARLADQDVPAGTARGAAPTRTGEPS